MKKIILLSIASFLYQNFLAQDTIVRFNGEKIMAKVLEIGSADIKYKKTGFLDGPTFVESKSDIYMIKYFNGTKDMIGGSEKRVEMGVPNKSNPDYTTEPEVVSTKIEGYYKNYSFKNRYIEEEELHSILMQTKDRKIMNLVKLSKHQKGVQNIAFGTIPFAIASTITIPYYLIYAFGYNNNLGDQYTVSERNKYALLGAISLVGTIACPVASGIAAKKRREYNQSAIQLYNQKY